MKKTTLLRMTSVAMLLGFLLTPLQSTALSTGTATITANGSYNFSTYSGKTELIINAGLTVTLVGYDSATPPDKPKITCKGQNTLTLDNLDITCTSAGVCPLTFLGSDNTLIAKNDNYLQGGAGAAGVSVGSGVELEIKGDGVLSCRGTSGGAGLGGNAGSDSGSILISGSSVHVIGEAIDGDGAGIGGGSGGSNGTLSITGGETMAIAGDRNGGAGIGGGKGGSAGTIAISGGRVLSMTAGSPKDIGPGYSGTGGTITFSGSAAVFLVNDTVDNPILVDPIEHVSPVDLTSASDFRGIPISGFWVYATGVYLPKASTPVSAIPDTGEDITPLYGFAGSGLIALAGMILRLRKGNKPRMQ